LTRLDPGFADPTSSCIIDSGQRAPMRIKATFRKDDAIIAEAEFDIIDSGNLREFGGLVFEEFRRLKPGISLVDEGVSVSFNTIRP
jgi:hypothetical protein